MALNTIRKKDVPDNLDQRFVRIIIMVNTKEKIEKIFSDLLNIDMYVWIVYPIEDKKLICDTADYIRRVTGISFHLEENHKFGHITVKREVKEGV